MPAEALPDSTLHALRFLEGIRADTLKRIADLPVEEALRVPDGCRNSIHWNVGHLLHVQLAHWYTRRGQPVPVDLGWKAYFREGKSPADYDANAPSWPALLDVYRQYSQDLLPRFGELLSEPLKVPFDYLGTRFATEAEDLHLLVFHEGEHFVLIKRILKALGRTGG